MKHVGTRSGTKDVVSQEQIAPTTGAVKVRLADNSTRNVQAVTTGAWAGSDDSKLNADFNTFTDGGSPVSTDWFPIRHGSLNLKLAWSSLVSAVVSAVGSSSGKLDADFSTSASGAPGQDADLLSIRRGASNLKLTLANFVSYLTSVARSWAGVQTFSAGAALGELSPTIKVKTVTGTMLATAGSANYVAAHGLTAAKILHVFARVSANDGSVVPPGGATASQNYSIYWGGDWVFVVTGAGASSNILSRPVTFLIFYTP